MNYQELKAAISASTFYGVSADPNTIAYMLLCCSADTLFVGMTKLFVSFQPVAGFTNSCRAIFTEAAARLATPELAPAKLPRLFNANELAVHLVNLCKKEFRYDPQVNSTMSKGIGIRKAEVRGVLFPVVFAAWMDDRMIVNHP